MIVVTGASGKLGRAIVDELTARVPAHGVGVSVRDPSLVADLAGRDVRVRRGDYTDSESLAHAFEGASQLLMVSSNARATGGDALAQHCAAIDAARRAGVQRIVYTSHMGASASSAFPPMHDHAATEAMLASCGVAWTALRNGFYASTVPALIGEAATSGVLAAPRDGKVAWTTHRDLAAAAAAILLADGGIDGPTPPLTAAAALDLDDVAAILAQLYGRAVERRVTTDDDTAAAMTARGMPAAAVTITLGLYRAARDGEFAQVDPMLATLIGRTPTRLREVLAAGVPDGHS